MDTFISPLSIDVITIAATILSTFQKLKVQIEYSKEKKKKKSRLRIELKGSNEKMLK